MGSRRAQASSDVGRSLVVQESRRGSLWKAEIGATVGDRGALDVSSDSIGLMQ